MAETLNQEPQDRLSERELAILRLMADGLSNQEIAEQLFLALTTIKWYIRQINDKLDTHTRTQTVARAHQLKLVGHSDTARVALAAEHEPPENPYKGLQAFQETDASDFFGRESLVERLVERLVVARFLAIVGPSGSGKSSVVKAGLIPALRRQHNFIADMLPGTHPLDELEIALLRIAPNPPPSLLPQLREDERGLLRAVRRVLPDDGNALLLVIDQFEEVYTLVENSAERQHFLDSLCASVTEPRSPLRVIITLRADFFDRPLLHPTFGSLLHQNIEVVLPLTVEELERAITRPAARVGVMVESALVTAIVAEVNQQPGGLPLLQYALTELFDRCQGNALTLGAYRTVGGALGALGLRADALYEAMDANEQEAARQMFLRLVTLGEGTEDTRRRTLQPELLSLGSVREMDDIIQTFAAYRLLTLDHDPATRTPTVELAHEAILREWKRLRAWLDENRADVRLQRLLANATAEWHNAGRDTGFLLTGSRLAQFEEWAAVTGLALTTDERAYVQESVAERERRTRIEQERQAREARLERRSRNFLRAFVVVLLLAMLGAFGLTGVAVRNEAQARSLALASAAQLALKEGNLQQAITLAQEAIQTTDNPPVLALRVLAEAAYGPETGSIFQESEDFVPGALAADETDLNFVIVSHFGEGYFFGDVMVRGMEDACAVLNVSCMWLGDWDNGSADMPKHWDEALAMDPDGIGTTIGDSEVSRGPVEQAAERGIPLIVFNVARGLESDPSLPALLYIGSDEFVSGQTNARRVFAEARADGVTIQRGVCANQAVGYPPTIARCAGVENVFNEAGVPLDLIPISLCEGPCVDPPETEALRIGEYFADHSETNAIFMLGPQPASSLNIYIRQAGLQPRQLYATSHDTSPEIFQMIRDGYLLQTIDQQPYMQGFQTIMSLYLYRQYGLRPSGFINTSSVVDRSNVDFISQLWDVGYR